MLLKITDSVEEITKFNTFLYNNYSRHAVIKDLTYLTDPTIDPFAIFSGKTDINGNLGTTFQVAYGNHYYVLEKAPHYIYDSDEEHFIDEYKLWTNEMKVSYDLQDNNIGNTRKVHHMFVKKMYNPRKQSFYYCFWTLKEYFEGRSILWFDYGADAPNDYNPFGKHQKGCLISMDAAKRFTKELLETCLKLLKLDYLPYRFNDDGIIIRYENDIIEWKFVQYHYFEKHPKVNIDHVRTIIMTLQSLLCWKICQYTNYSTHNLAKNHTKHPFWTGLSNLLNNRYENYNKQQDESYKSGNYKRGEWPESSMQELSENVESFLNYVIHN